MKIKNKLYSFFIRVTLRLHNFCYRVISKLVLLENNGTHPKHRIMDYGSFFVNNVNESDKVIDIGCGKGEVAYLISSRAKAVVAVDLKEKNINHAKNKFRCANLIYIVADAVSYKWDQKFDKVILSNVLEHIDDRINFLQKLHSVASTILLRVPMINRDWLVMYKKEKGVKKL